VYYYLFSPADLRPAITKSGNIDVTATDATPTANNLTGNASLITPHPQPGLWEIDVMQGATTDGTEFSQTVSGTVAYNQLGAFTETGLPKSTSKTIPAGSSVPISATVTNTTDHVGFFELQSSSGDISGGNASTPLQLGPEQTGTLTATLSPTAAAGTKVHGFLSIIDSTDWGVAEPAVGFPESYSDFHDFPYVHDFPYAYTVG